MTEFKRVFVDTAPIIYFSLLKMSQTTNADCQMHAFINYILCFTKECIFKHLAPTMIYRKMHFLNTIVFSFRNPY